MTNTHTPTVPTRETRAELFKARHTDNERADAFRALTSIFTNFYVARIASDIGYSTARAFLWSSTDLMDNPTYADSVKKKHPMQYMGYDILRNVLNCNGSKHWVSSLQDGIEFFEFAHMDKPDNVSDFDHKYPYNIVRDALKEVRVLMIQLGLDTYAQNV